MFNTGKVKSSVHVFQPVVGRDGVALLLTSTLVFVSLGQHNRLCRGPCMWLVFLHALTLTCCRILLFADVFVICAQHVFAVCTHVKKCPSVVTSSRAGHVFVPAHMFDQSSFLFRECNCAFVPLHDSVRCGGLVTTVLKVPNLLTGVDASSAFEGSHRWNPILASVRHTQFVLRIVSGTCQNLKHNTHTHTHLHLHSTIMHKHTPLHIPALTLLMTLSCFRSDPDHV